MHRTCAKPSTVSCICNSRQFNYWSQRQYLITKFSQIIRPPEIPVGGLLFYHEFFLPSFFFFRRLISELAERNSTKIGHMLGSNCDLKTRVQNLRYVSPPLQIGGPKPPFGRLRNLTATLMAYIFGKQHDINSRPSGLINTRGFLHRPKMSWTLVHKRL